MKHLRNKKEKDTMGKKRNDVSKNNGTPAMRCCVCGQRFVGFGNNPRPIPHKADERCCDDCNSRYVVPLRIIEWSANME